MLDISGVTWVVTIGLVVLLLAVDLVAAGVRPHRVGFREATAWSVFYILVAVEFGVWFALVYGGDAGTEYFAGFIVEKSLSVDNLFVFVIVIVMTTFAVPEEHQHKVLTLANAFALLGLRALYFLVKGLLDRLVYLSTGLALILAFIGVKLILHWAHVDVDPAVPEIPTPVSLGVIVVVLVVVTVASLVRTRRDPSAKAHPGSLRGHRPGERDHPRG